MSKYITTGCMIQQNFIHLLLCRSLLIAIHLLGVTHAMLAGAYLWLTLSDGTVTAWDTRYGVLSFTAPAMSPLNGAIAGSTHVQISAVVVSENLPSKDTTTSTTTINSKQYHYYLTIASSVEGAARATSVMHGPLSLPSGDLHSLAILFPIFNHPVLVNIIPC